MSAERESNGEFPWRAAALCALAWLIPSAGHFALGRRARATIFAAVIATALLVGYSLDRNLHRLVPGQPLLPPQPALHFQPLVSPPEQQAETESPAGPLPDAGRELLRACRCAR